MRILKSLLVICCVAALFGCAYSSGTKVEQSSVSKIKKGVTTKSDLTAMFGEPNSTSFDADGKETDRWTYWSSKASGSSYIPIYGAFNQNVKNGSSILEVKLNKDKIVDDFSLTQATDNMQPGQGLQ